VSWPRSPRQRLTTATAIHVPTDWWHLRDSPGHGDFTGGDSSAGSPVPAGGLAAVVEAFERVDFDRVQQAR
jgi:hypothetical protein